MTLLKKLEAAKARTEAGKNWASDFFGWSAKVRPEHSALLKFAQRIARSRDACYLTEVQAALDELDGKMGAA